MICNPIYNLPELSFIGGETQSINFNLVLPSGGEFDANGCTVRFSVVNYADKNGSPIFVIPATLEKNEDGVICVASVKIKSENTVGLHGRYVYQISILDTFKEFEIPGQGIIDIRRNIDQAFIQ